MAHRHHSGLPREQSLIGSIHLHEPAVKLNKVSPQCVQAPRFAIVRPSFNSRFPAATVHIHWCGSQLHLLRPSSLLTFWQGATFTSAVTTSKHLPESANDFRDGRLTSHKILLSYLLITLFERILSHIQQDSPLKRIDMVSFKSAAVAVALAGQLLVSAVNLDVNNLASIKAASRQLAYGVQAWYHSNGTGQPAVAIGTFPPPSYWWEGGAIWGGMVDHWAYTNDSSWNAVISQALIAQIGPDSNYMPPTYRASLGNDDQAFWALAALSAMEYGFEVPAGRNATVWLDLSRAVFDSQVPRWETATCGGGLRWQIYPENQGYNYKNTISNGGLFQISARLARYTGNQTYVEWANKTWDWMSAIGLIGPKYKVFDGGDIGLNCSQLDHTQWSYNSAMLIYGTATMANLTNQQIWKDRTEALLTNIENSFFSPYSNATNIMYEQACEPRGACNYDQLSFKAYLARWMAKAAVVYPPIAANVRKYLQTSAQAAAKSCTGGADGKTCGVKWYVGGYDGVYGVGQELSAMETVQALILLETKLAPRHQQNVTIPVVPVTSTYPLTAPTSIPTSISPPNPSSTHSSSASSTRSSTNFGVRSTLTTVSSSWSMAATAVMAALVAMAFGDRLGFVR